MKEATFANTDLSYFYSFIFKKITVSLKKEVLQKKLKKN